MPIPLTKKPKRGSKYAKKIDPVRFHVAYEGIDAEKEYFEELSKAIGKRFRNLIQFIPVDKSSTDSAPQKVVSDLVAHLDHNSINLNAKSHIDRGFVVIDTDHHFTGAHNRGTQESLRLCRQKGVQIIITNPCFELWLMCHYEDIGSKDGDFKEKLFLNHKHENNRNKTFSKVEYSKMKSEAQSEGLIKRLPIALENERKINNNCTTKDQLPPSQLYSGVGEIIKQMIDVGFIVE